MTAFRSVLAAWILAASLRAWGAPPGVQGFSPDDAGAGSPRSVGLASSLVAAPDEEISLDQNPAGLGSLTHWTLAWEQHSGWGGLAGERLILGAPSGFSSGWAAAVRTEDYGTFEGRDLQGNLAGNYAASLWQVKAGWGSTWNNGLALGATLDGFHQDLAGTGFWGESLQLGALWSPLSTYALGAALSGLGLDDQGSLEPPSLVLGISRHWTARKFHFLAAASFESPSFASAGVHAGVEASYARLLAIRVGYQWREEGASLDGLAGGFGIGFKGFRVDYGYQPFGRFGPIQRLGLVYEFSNRAYLDDIEARAKMAEQESRDDDAGRQWVKVLKADPGNGEAEAGLDRLETRRFRPDPKRPFDSLVGSLYGEALQAVQAGDYLTASAKLSQASELEPDQVQVRKLLAEADARAALERKGRSIRELLSQAQAFMAEEHWQDSRRCLQQAQELDPGHAGLAELRQKFESQTQTKAKRLTALASEALQAEKRDRAALLLRQAQDLDPDLPEETKVSADLARSDPPGQIEKDRFKKVLAMGFEALQSSDYYKARRCFNQVLQIDPGNKQAALGQAKVEATLGALKQGRLKDSSGLLKEAQRLASLGASEQALKLFNKVLSIDPENRTAKEARANLIKEMKGVAGGTEKNLPSHLAPSPSRDAGGQRPDGDQGPARQANLSVPSE
jgi:tetratricopeptide (TPR) repeat protein